MDFESHRFAQNAALGYSNHYYFNERNLPLSMATNARSDPRSYPMGGPVGGRGLRGGMGREDGTMENGQSRRRIAVACARCRKRKIRCSGDPGDGTTCDNCKQAGVDPSVCQFHRVGSGEPARVIDDYNRVNSLTSIANPLMPMYIPRNSAYPRGIPNQYPQSDTKAVYPQAWTVPYYDEPAPVETYNLDQPSAVFLPTQNTMAGANDYGAGYGWSQGKSLQNGANSFLETEASPGYGSGTHGLPYAQTSLRGVANSEALSPLNMTSLQLTLPERPRPGQTLDGTSQRQLPIPQPSPAQSARNVVDQLQDQRLRSARAIGGGSSLSSAGGFPKSAMSFASESDIQGPVSTGTSTSADLATQVTAPAPMPSVSEGMMEYLPVATSANDEASVARTSQPQLNFSTSTLLGSMPAPVISTTYSNFRNYDLPTSASTETLSPLARQDSQTNLYSFSPDTSKRHSSGDSNKSALVSGHRYTPLSRTQPQHQSRVDDSARDSFTTRQVPVHRSSMGTLNRSF